MLILELDHHPATGNVLLSVREQQHLNDVYPDLHCCPESGPHLWTQYGGGPLEEASLVFCSGCGLEITGARYAEHHELTLPSRPATAPSEPLNTRAA